MNQSLISQLKRIWFHISFLRRSQFLFLLGLTLLSSIAEIVSLGAVLPFIGIITQPEIVFAQPWMAILAEAMGIETASELVLPLTITFAAAALVAGALRLLLLWVSVRVGHATGADLSINVYLRTLYQDYSVHISRSSSEIISGLTLKVDAASSVLTAVISIATSVILMIVIILSIVVIEPMIALFTMGSFGLSYLAVAWFSRLRLASNSESIAKEQDQVVKALQEGLGAIREVLLDRSQGVYIDIYRKAILQLQRAKGENSFINQAPRFAMEALGMVLIALFVLFLSNRAEGIAASLPILGLIALAAQRLLPLMQRSYSGWALVAGNKEILNDVLTLLEQPLPTWVNEPKSKPLEFKESINIDNISFRYSDNSPWIVNDINVVIPKGSRVGIIGNTGSGKSTFMDLLMGLIKPTKGQIMVDGKLLFQDYQRAWQETIAHVPQNIFLSDSSIAENIAFGVHPDNIDLERVQKAAKQAQISDFIESNILKYDAIVGERGVRLSGGQCQRIGIARALYKQCNVLIFDEATSSLDLDTERAVMQTIEDLSKDLTMFIIAHRITTLKECDKILLIKDGKLIDQGSYKLLIRNNINFKHIEKNNK